MWSGYARWRALRSRRRPQRTPQVTTGVGDTCPGVSVAGMRCVLTAGHTGDHSNGVTQWGDIGEREKAAPFAAGTVGKAAAIDRAYARGVEEGRRQGRADLEREQANREEPTPAEDRAYNMGYDAGVTDGRTQLATEFQDVDTPRATNCWTRLAQLRTLMKAQTTTRNAEPQHSDD